MNFDSWVLDVWEENLLHSAYAFVALAAKTRSLNGRYVNVGS